MIFPTLLQVQVSLQSKTSSVIFPTLLQVQDSLQSTFYNIFQWSLPPCQMIWSWRHHDMKYFSVLPKDLVVMITRHDGIQQNQRDAALVSFPRIIWSWWRHKGLRSNRKIELKLIHNGINILNFYFTVSKKFSWLCFFYASCHLHNCSASVQELDDSAQNGRTLSSN